MVKKRKRSAIVRDLDREFSLFIRKRDGHRCVLCRSVEMPQCGHLYSRIAYSTRWDEENCFCQCAGCNIRHENDQWPFINWYIAKFGQEKFEEVRARWHKPRQFKDFQLQELLDEYRKKRKDDYVCFTQEGGQIQESSVEGVKHGDPSVGEDVQGLGKG